MARKIIIPDAYTPETVAAAYHYRESCSHCYASGEYYRDGSVTTLTATRNSLRRMEAAQQSATA